MRKSYANLRKISKYCAIFAFGLNPSHNFSIYMLLSDCCIYPWSQDYINGGIYPWSQDYINGGIHPWSQDYINDQPTPKQTKESNN